MFPVAARSKVWGFGHSLAEIEGSNPTAGIVVCLVHVVFCQVEVSAMGPSIYGSPTEGAGVTERATIALHTCSEQEDEVRLRKNKELCVFAS